MFRWDYYIFIFQRRFDIYFHSLFRFLHYAAIFSPLMMAFATSFSRDYYDIDTLLTLIRRFRHITPPLADYAASFRH